MLLGGGGGMGGSFRFACHSSSVSVFVGAFELAHQWEQALPGTPTTLMRDGLYRLASLFQLRYPQLKDLLLSADATSARAPARCNCRTCVQQLDAFGDHGFGCDANKPQRTLGHNHVDEAPRAGARVATGST